MSRDTASGLFKPLRINPASREYSRAIAAWSDPVVAAVDVTFSALELLSVKLPRPKFKATSFLFPEPGAPILRQQPTTDSARSQARESTTYRNRQSYTRVRPPSDTVKLSDRLFYVLQPPVETWLAAESMDFAFEPFPYQYEGIAFLYSHVGAVLADEMGLGKTMQAITAIRMLLYSGEVQSALLVCPKPLVTNWQREFAIWAPEVPLNVIGGSRGKRQWQWTVPDAPVRIANYELLVRDQDLLTSGELQFDLMVLDEAQRIKNRASATSKVVCAVTRDRSWALTGTPVENSADDLYGIFEFLSPGLLSPAMTPKNMGRVAGNHILRRTKDGVLDDLPPKLFRDAELELSAAQAESYELAESQGVIRLTDMGDEATIQHVFELVLRLKQICNFDPATGESSKFERLLADMEEVAASGQKAIVFSQWVQTIRTLNRQLDRFSPLVYHGKVPSSRRDAILAEFKTDPSRHVLLMSYGAGSVGLNLQFCAYVFLFDRWWNPAVEDQAINRAHRIGVQQPVTVTRFISLGTIEERIDQILAEKRDLFDAILSQADRPAKLGLTRQDVFGLFNLMVQGKPRAA